jgi:hypothetical protein
MKASRFTEAQKAFVLKYVRSKPSLLQITRLIRADCDGPCLHPPTSD